MSTVKEALSASATITCTIDSLAASATVGRASTKVDNSTNLYLDAHLMGSLVFGAGTPSADKTVYIYGYGSIDTGTTYTEGVTGTDAGFTINNSTNLRLITAVAIPTGSTTFKFGPVSVAAAFGGMLPQYWGLVVVNNTGLALSTGNSLLYAGVTATVV